MKLKPEAGEVWRHSLNGSVLILRRWNENECLCSLLEKRGRRALLRDELMVERVMPASGGELKIEH